MGETTKSITFVVVVLLLWSSMVSSDIIPGRIQNNPMIVILETIRNIVGDIEISDDPLGCNLLDTTPINATVCSALDVAAQRFNSTPQAIFNSSLTICGLNTTQPFSCN
ncbi:hypothetical protein DEO72_LG5g319 [Vigna unguiculata]|uniref:Hydrophobic seed protein n=1 Tax=Vigna unguiculata TaxID=3917 RepID=A0A4D6LUJ6_VIGUN|nr:hypothetical protein DEO72_LG5g319 [Vigna unguiculata]